MPYGFYFDQSKCIGCHTCQVACKDRHDIQKAGARPRRVGTYEAGSFPDVGMFHIAISCNHCENPACVNNCPTAAMYKNAEGIVVHDDNTCIQCKSCMMVCPYGAPQFDKQAKKIVKCDSCLDLRKAGHDPNCVAACPMRALDFGEIDELKAKYGEGLVDDLPFLPTPDFTHPRMLIKPAKSAERADVREVTL